MLAYEMYKERKMSELVRITKKKHALLLHLDRLELVLLERLQELCLHHRRVLQQLLVHPTVLCDQRVQAHNIRLQHAEGSVDLM